ncbi:unnamed protein product [Medioppia subpectinata]|uniref:F-box domain-containing protein n=1 Tax=Medioppia subpectinata TaxID=1979941 RepID=A0A7R9Q3W1_9ACAR|nr:unnamed protein product [Medioppia subpectinata]CAG2111734.1 unnamed protein product [Medioppia subpectinata]
MFTLKILLHKFGDDMCQHILSYLSGEERFRYESVSKQWQRVVYETQTELIIDKYFKDKRILKKCKNITRIAIKELRYLTDVMCGIIIRHCNRLNDLSICFPKCDENVVWDNDDEFEDPYLEAIYLQRTITPSTSKKFLVKFAQQLQTISVDHWFGKYWNEYNDWFWRDFAKKLNKCTNLRSLKIHSRESYWHLFNGSQNECLFTRLQTIDVRSDECDIKSFNTFVDNYKSGLKFMAISVSDKQPVRELMNGMSQMKALTHVEIDDGFMEDVLTQLAVHCPQLKRLTIHAVHRSQKMVFSYIEIINENFIHLKRLEMLDCGRRPILSAGRLNQCKQLTHLSYDCFGDDSFFTCISDNLPKLEYLKIKCATITDAVLDGLSKLPKLQTLALHGNQHYTPIAVKNFIDNCAKIKRFIINKKIVSIHSNKNLSVKYEPQLSAYNACDDYESNCEYDYSGDLLSDYSGDSESDYSGDYEFDHYEPDHTAGFDFNHSDD